MVARGRGESEKLPYLLAGGTSLYIGGMFLNDAFDVGFDQQYRKERPIPSRAIGLKTVWVWGVGWLALGLCCLAWIGASAGMFGVALTGCIVLYDAVHKRVNFAPVLMGLCRFVLYLAAASMRCKWSERKSNWVRWRAFRLYHRPELCRPPRKRGRTASLLANSIGGDAYPRDTDS